MRETFALNVLSTFLLQAQWGIQGIGEQREKAGGTDVIQKQRADSKEVVPRRWELREVH